MNNESSTIYPVRFDRDARAVLDALRKFVRALRVASRAAEKKSGLSGAQVFVLQKLADGNAVSLNELAARTLTHQSSVSVVVQRLVERRLIRRRPSNADKRRIELSLTAKGLKMTRDCHDLAQDRLIRALREMPRTQRSQTAALLDDLLARAGLYSTPAPLFLEEDNATAPRKEV
jgi:DNA-binding MarR family transcriptional regulator